MCRNRQCTRHHLMQDATLLTNSLVGHCGCVYRSRASQAGCCCLEQLQIKLQDLIRVQAEGNTARMLAVCPGVEGQQRADNAFVVTKICLGRGVCMSRCVVCNCNHPYPLDTN